MDDNIGDAFESEMGTKVAQDPNFTAIIQQTPFLIITLHKKAKVSFYIVCIPFFKIILLNDVCQI